VHAAMQNSERPDGAVRGTAGDVRVLLGTIVGVHGVRGAVKIRSYTADPAAIADYGPLSDASGERRFKLRVIGEARGNVVAKVEGVDDRDAAERLRGIELYVPRDALPPPEDEDEYYQADLIGLNAVTEDGTPYGAIVDIRDFGAGDLLEIRPAEGGPTVYLPFTREVVPVIDIEGGRIVVVPPTEVSA
jgi:16S rRNA processing protein RimM